MDLRAHRFLVEPARDRVRVEPEKVSPLDVGDAALRHELSDVTHADPKVFRHASDVYEVRQLHRRAGLVDARRLAALATRVFAPLRR